MIGFSRSWVLTTFFMTWVKICGMTSLEDALCAVEAGADAVGFVFYEKSPRNITPEAVTEIVAQLPEEIEKVGVFVGTSVEGWAQVVLSTGLTAVQHYMPLEPDVQSHRAKILERAVFPKPPKLFLALPIGFFLEAGAPVEELAKDFEHLRDEEPGRSPSSDGLFDTFFLDSGGLQSPGGTGKQFNWVKAAPIAEGMRRGHAKLVVAGGLTPLNVGEAINILKPWGVDVVSGVEMRPGKKDPDKVRAFVRAVREIDWKAS
jgi:phosphoribosylanthranilate isomerase